MLNESSKTIPVHGMKLVPFSNDQNGFGRQCRFIRICTEGDVWKNQPSLCDRLRIVRPNDCTLFDQDFQECNGRRKANVVCIGLKGKTPDGKFFPAQNPQLLTNLFYERLDSALIDVFNFF